MHDIFSKDILSPSLSTVGKSSYGGKKIKKYKLLSVTLFNTPIHFHMHLIRMSIHFYLFLWCTDFCSAQYFMLYFYLLVFSGWFEAIFFVFCRCTRCINVYKYKYRRTEIECSAYGCSRMLYHS